MEEYGTAGDDADDNIIGRMRIACWITKTTDTRSEYVCLLLFNGNNSCENAPEYYVYTYIACIFICLYFL